MTKRALPASLRITLIYLVFALCWIIFSDAIVEALSSDIQTISRIQSYKGIAFVVLTALLLFSLLLRHCRNIEQVYQLDGLTGLLNYTLFKSQVDQRIATLGPGEKLVLGYLDINRFKDLNESIGIERADQFICRLADEFIKYARPGTLIGRLPPDQFAIAREVTDEKEVEERIRGYQALFLQVANSMGIDAQCSIAVALYPDDGSNARTLMNATSQALSLAKQTGNNLQYHDKTLTEQATQRRHLVDAMKVAIANKGFSVVYQPKYALASGTVSGVEVLIRWQHPVDGFISPAEFIPLAEEYGLSHPITRLVIDKASQELGSSGLLGTAIQQVSINISATEFNRSTDMDALMAHLKGHPEFAPFVRIEITETATLNDMAQSSTVIQKLRNEGLGISIDDFGTGYTSLAMLKDFTIDEIKIDRCFVSEVTTCSRSHTIIKAIIAMADSFGINVVAEGVEEAHQLDALQKLGCREAQGYLLGVPMTIEQLQRHVGTASSMSLS